jgi:hypothetical protein
VVRFFVEAPVLVTQYSDGIGLLVDPGQARAQQELEPVDGAFLISSSRRRQTLVVLSALFSRSSGSSGRGFQDIGASL